MKKKQIKTQQKSKQSEFTIPKINADDVIPSVKNGSVRERAKHNNNRFWKSKKNKTGLSWWNRKKLKNHPEKSYLIRMLFSNGTSKEFVIVTNEEVFQYKKRTYYLRYEDSYFNLTQNQYELTYFDDYAVPIDRKIEKTGDKAYFSVTSSNLRPLIEMKYIQTLANAQELDKYLKLTAILSGMIILLTLINTWQVFRIAKVLIGGGG